MHRLKYYILPFMMLAGLHTNAQCNANFGYTYNPALAQPEESIYIFADSSTGVDSSTTYEWSFGTGDFSSVKNPTFTYEAADSGLEQVCLTIHNTDNGCTSQYCRTLHVDDLCIAANYSYDARGFTCNYKANICGSWDSIHWDFGDGTEAVNRDSVTHTYAAVADSYYVCMEVMIGSECQKLFPCKAIYCRQIHLYPADITSLSLSGAQLKVYPDPAHGYVQVSVAEGAYPIQLSIADITGKTVLKTEVQSSAQQISVAALDAGFYLVSAQGISVPNYSTRFIKQ